MENKETKAEDITLPVNHIQSMIFTFRGIQVMVDRDLATVYEVETKVLNQAVKRNLERFPQEFRFQLTDTEKEELVTNCDRFKSLKHSTGNPYVFTEQGIFYDGQVYDTYTFVCDLIRKAVKSLVLIDNYVDDSVLTLLSKRKSGVSATIYTKNKSKQLSLDLKKHNEQYPAITARTLKGAHDRFLIIDEKEIYHIGASLKDLGKKMINEN